MSNIGFFDKNNKSSAYTNPYTTLLGDIMRVTNIISNTFSFLVKDENLLNPDVILPFLEAAKGALNLLHNEVKTAGKFSKEFGEFKEKYDHLINDTIVGLKEACFDCGNKLSQRYVEGVISQLQWHIKLSEALTRDNVSTRIHRPLIG